STRHQRFSPTRRSSDLFYAWARRDRTLARLTRELAGLRPPLAPDPFETLVTSITAQQVSLHAAFAVRSRLIQRFGRRAGQAYSRSEEHTSELQSLAYLV